MIGMLKKMLAHCAIIISLMYVVFFCIDLVNPAMGFIDNNITKPLLLVLVIIAIINAIQIIAEERRKLRRRMRRQNRSAR